MMSTKGFLWLHVSLHLTNGKTHSCYQPHTHKIETNELANKPSALQNTKQKKTQKKEKGCTEPLYGKKSQCIVKIVPQDKKNKTFQMDDKCIKKRVQND